MINPYVNLFFRAFNTIFFLAVSIYVFKKYLKKKLVFEMSRKEKTMQNLLEKQHALEQEIRSIEDKAEQDKALIAQLKEKVSLWGALHQNQFALQEEKIKQGITFLHSYKMAGIDRYVQYKDRSKLLLSLKQDLHAHARSHYSTIDAQKKFLSRAMENENPNQNSMERHG